MVIGGETLTRLGLLLTLDAFARLGKRRNMFAVEEAGRAGAGTALRW
jgi:hypothetical protein